MHHRRRQNLDLRLQAQRPDAPDHPWRIPCPWPQRSPYTGRRAARATQQGGRPRAMQDAERAAKAQTTLTFGELCDLYIAHVRAAGKISWKTDRGYLEAAKGQIWKPARHIDHQTGVDGLFRRDRPKIEVQCEPHPIDGSNRLGLGRGARPHPDELPRRPQKGGRQGKRKRPGTDSRRDPRISRRPGRRPQSKQKLRKPSPWRSKASC